MLPLVNDAYQTLKPYVPGKPVAETERELGISGAVKLASNENPLGPSPKALAAIQAALPSLNDYPDGSAYYLRQGLAEFLSVGQNQLIFGNGTNEVLEMVVRTCVRPGENVVFGAPSFIVYKLVSAAAAVEGREVAMQDMAYDLDAMLAAVDANTKLVFLANPNNPTGTYVDSGALGEFMERLPEHVLLVLDEAYFEYATAQDYPDGLGLLAKRERLLVLRTFSKAYGLAGLRVGYGVSHATLIDYLNRGRQPFNTNSLAQVGALAALGDQAHVQAAVQLNGEEMARVVPALRQIGLKVWDSQANFVLVDFDRDGAEVYDRLLCEGVIVRPMGGYGLPTCARVTLGTREQNDRLLTAIAGL